jgi:hypothetical protein
MNDQPGSAARKTKDVRTRMTIMHILCFMIFYSIVAPYGMNARKETKIQMSSKQTMMRPRQSHFISSRNPRHPSAIPD